MASIVSSSIPNSAADIGLSSDLGNYTNDTATVAVNVSSLLSGAGSFVLPAVVTLSEAGERSTGYSDLFYNHIWIIPNRTDLGNLVQDQVIAIEVWNAYFNANELTGITVAGDDTGLVLTGPTTHSFVSLESLIYSLAASTTGAPSINVEYDFKFRAFHSPFPAVVVGERVIPFSLRHNWADSVLEQISAKTDIIPALSGKEQRIGLRQAPRRRIEMSYLTLTPQDRASLENLLFGWHGRTFLVPMWQDVSPLQVASLVGDTVFPADTVNKDFDANEFVYITDGVHSDILEVDSLTSGTVTTKRGAANAYSAGARIAPARFGVLESKVSLSRLTSDAESMRFAWLILAGEISLNRRSPYTPVTYRGLEVYNVGNDYSQEIKLDQEIQEEMIDAEIGLFAKYAIEGVSRRTIPFRQLLIRSELGQFIEWMTNRDGQRVPFWFVERIRSFTLTSDEISTSQEITVVSNGYTNLVQTHSARRDVAILTSTGWIYRRINSSVNNGDGTETLQLDAVLGVGVNAADNPMISYLKCVRLNQDMVELSYITTDAISTSTSFIDVLTN